MKRFASHYLLLPDIGFVKQQVIEVDGEGIVVDIFPLTEEIESVEWMPGVIVLITADQLAQIKNTGMIVKNILVFQFNLPIVSFQSSLYSPSQFFKSSSFEPSDCLKAFIENIAAKRVSLYPILLYPFDFTSMQPVGGTQHKLLR